MEKVKNASPLVTASQRIRYTQNFLKSEELVGKLIQRADIQEGDTVLEVGPGKGIITQKLAQQVGKQGRVIAVELDVALAKELQQTFRDTPQVEIIQQDILQFPLQSLPVNYQVFANIPFNITAHIFETFFQSPLGPKTAHLIVQKQTLLEDKNKQTFKSLLIQPLYAIKKVHDFSRNDFSPPPSVETALFRFDRRDQSLVALNQYSLFQDFLAFVSRDRVGEGSWSRLLKKTELKNAAAHAGLQWGRGIKSQSLEGLLDFFVSSILPQRNTHSAIKGALAVLRKEQEKTALLNELGGHHRSKMRGR